MTQDQAALATDGRYFNQAAHQLDDNWILLKQGLQDVPTWQEWSAEHSVGGKVVGVDASLLPGSAAKKLADKIRKSGGADLLPMDENLVDLVWAESRPSRPQYTVTILPDSIAGKSTQSKLAELRQELEKKKSPGILVSMLDEVAWLFNLRGSDIPYNPVFFSYAMITPDKATLFVDATKIGEDCLAYLTSNQVEIKPYDTILDSARHLQASIKEQSTGDAQPPGRFLVSSKGSWALKRALGGAAMVDEVRSPIGDAKAIKNDTEMTGMRACHVRDGAALIAYFAWLEDQLVAKKAVMDEVQAADKLEELRTKQQNFVGLSFNTISSTGAK